jgi:SAM-dependent methyltransferase
MVNAFKNFLRAGPLGVFVNPIFICENSLKKLIKSAINHFKINKGMRWIDVGCGTRPYEDFFPEGVYFGVDVENSGRSHGLKNPDFFYDGNRLPFEEGSIDGVLCTQVLEHVADPEAFLSEISRVLKPGGGLVLSLPLTWQEHEVPFDFFRFTRFGIEVLLTVAGLRMINHKRDVNAIGTIAVLFNVYLVNTLRNGSRITKLLVFAFICFPVQILAVIGGKLLPDDGRLYLNQVVTAVKK